MVPREHPRSGQVERALAAPAAEHAGAERPSAAEQRERQQQRETISATPAATSSTRTASRARRRASSGRRRRPPRRRRGRPRARRTRCKRRGWRGAATDAPPRRSGALTSAAAPDGLGLVGVARWQRPQQARALARAPRAGGPRRDGRPGDVDVDWVRSRTWPSRESSASALSRRAVGMRSSNAPPPPLSLATLEAATMPPKASVDAQDPSATSSMSPRARGERERGAALLGAAWRGRRARAAAAPGRRAAAAARRSRRPARAAALGAVGALGAAARGAAAAGAAVVAESSRRAVDGDGPTTSSATQAKPRRARARAGGASGRAHGERRGGRGKPAAARASSRGPTPASGRGGSSRRSSPSSASSGGRVSRAASPAFRSFVMARCSWVPALESLTPSTAASSALSGRRGTSGRRARGRAAAGRRARRGRRRARGRARRPRRAPRAASSGSADERGGALAPAQLVERGVARDPEQPGARRRPAGVEAARLRKARSKASAVTSSAAARRAAA